MEISAEEIKVITDNMDITYTAIICTADESSALKTVVGEIFSNESYPKGTIHLPLSADDIRVLQAYYKIDIKQMAYFMISPKCCKFKGTLKFIQRQFNVKIKLKHQQYPYLLFDVEKKILTNVSDIVKRIKKEMQEINKESNMVQMASILVNR